MKRRSFFGALLGAASAPLVKGEAPVQTFEERVLAAAQIAHPGWELKWSCSTRPVCQHFIYVRWVQGHRYIWRFPLQRDATDAQIAATIRAHRPGRDAHCEQPRLTLEGPRA